MKCSCIMELSQLLQELAFHPSQCTCFIKDRVRCNEFVHWPNIFFQRSKVLWGEFTGMFGKNWIVEEVEIDKRNKTQNLFIRE